MIRNILAALAVLLTAPVRASDVCDAHHDAHQCITAILDLAQRCLAARAPNTYAPGTTQVPGSGSGVAKTPEGGAVFLQGRPQDHDVVVCIGQALRETGVTEDEGDQP